MTYGYAGQILRINLTTRQVSKEPLDMEEARLYLGGMGLSAKLLYDEVGPEVSPSSPDNLFIMAAGPLVGTLAPTSARVEVSAKSPLTGLIGSGNGGGFWGPALKYAGYDAVVVKGKAEKPVYLWIDDDRVEIRDATHLWGKDCWDTVDTIRREVGERVPHEVRVASIGPAGENLVRYGCVMFDYYNSAARGGMGAVAGDKKLKAVAVRGSGGVKIHDPQGFLQQVTDANSRIRQDPTYYRAWQPGGIIGMAGMYQGKLCGRNFQTGYLPDWQEKMGQEVVLKHLNASPNPHSSGIACHCCPLRCYHWVEMTEGKYKGLKVSGLFLAFVRSWAAQCGITHPPAVWKLEEMGQRLGIDAMSAAGCIAFAMELYQRGIISAADADGLRLEWGNQETTIELLTRIAYRRGFGDVLAEGNVRAAKRIGRGAENYVMTIKNLEIKQEDPRAESKVRSFGLLTSPRGGDNMKTTHTMLLIRSDLDRMKKERGMADAEFDRWLVGQFDMFQEAKEAMFGVPPRIDLESWDGVPAMAKWHEDLTSVVNGLGTCIIKHILLTIKLGPDYLSGLLSSCTGWDITPRELMEAGERIFNLQRAYLARHGIGKKDDRWPERFYQEPLPVAPGKTATLSREKTAEALDKYYELRGWDQETGIPTRETLVRLGLSAVADDLEKIKVKQDGSRLSCRVGMAHQT